MQVEGLDIIAPDIIGALRAGAEDNALALEMVCWRGGAAVTQRWTRAELFAAVSVAAGAIARGTREGDRIIVALPPGLDFASAFLACLATGRIAAPAQAPTTARARALIDRMATVIDARLVLTDPAEIAGGGGADFRTPDPGVIAYLQFTSGSTQAPRGAVITHGALAANLAAIGDAWRLGPTDHGVFWLPPFHDMGLVGALLTPVAFAFPATLMHPAAFLQRPARWLELITDRRASFSGAPNFAYDLCVDRIDAAARAGFDLSSWRVAVNGAEPVSAATIRRFEECFASRGLRRGALAPGYGLAESVLFVTARRGGSEPAKTDAHHVSCGPAGRGMCVRIVEESTGTAVPDSVTGAIWVAGPSLADGYWQAPEETNATFGARLAGESLTFMRTGDIGFLRDGELHVCGRAKDVIIRAGRKVHAADIEQAIARALDTPAGRRTAVFACAARDAPERLVVVHEVGADGDNQSICAAIADSLGAHFDLVADAIVLAAPGAVRVTSSGKIARAATREAYLAGALAPLAQRTP